MYEEHHRCEEGTGGRKGRVIPLILRAKPSRMMVKYIVCILKKRRTRPVTVIDDGDGDNTDTCKGQQAKNVVEGCRNLVCLSMRHWCCSLDLNEPNRKVSCPLGRAVFYLQMG